MDLPVSVGPKEITSADAISSATEVDRLLGDTSAGEKPEDRGAGLRQRRAGAQDGMGSHVDQSEGRGARPPWLDNAVRALCVLVLLLSLALLASFFQVLKLQRVLGPAMGPGEFSRSTSSQYVPDSVIEAACNSKEQAELKKHLHKIVLIINTNYEDAARSTSDLLRGIYSRFFDEIVIISKLDIPDLHVEARGQRPWRNDWMFAYFHLPKVISKFPNAEGYLWTNDDVALNYWHLLKANKSRLWLPNDLNSSECKFFPFDQNTKAQYFDYWAGNKEVRDSAWKAYRALDDNYREKYINSILPLHDVYPKRITDILYIPQSFAHKLSFDLIPVFREYKIWSEIAIPFMFYALDNPKNFDPVFDDMLYVWNRDKYDPAKRWSPGISALHPWKLSKKASKVEYLKALGSVDTCVLRLLPSVEKS